MSNSTFYESKLSDRDQILALYAMFSCFPLLLPLLYSQDASIEELYMVVVEHLFEGIYDGYCAGSL